MPSVAGALHVALLPHGNGRWAAARGLPQAAGQRAGVEAVRRSVRAAPALGIGTLTIHALCADGWKRPRAELLSILALVAEFLADELGACRAQGVRVTLQGRRDRLPEELRQVLAATERETAAGGALHLRLALDDASHDALLATVLDQAARAIVAAALGAQALPGAPVPDVDLLVRTGGEPRIGEVLPWECACAELVLVDTPWPEFGAQQLAAAVAEYRRRERCRGGLPAQDAGAGARP